MKTEDLQLAYKLLMDIRSKLHFDPGILAYLVRDMIRTGRVKDNRKGVRVANFAYAETSSTIAQERF